MSDTLILALSFAGIFGLVGIVCVIGGIIMKKNVREIQTRCTEKNEAEIIDILEEKDYDAENHLETYYIPVYEYTVGDKKIRKRSNYSTQKYKKGDKIEIYYNPENPSDSYVKELESTGMANGVIIVGIIIIAVGIYLGISIIKDKQ